MTLQRITTLAFIFWLCNSCESKTTSTPTQPNFIVILTDDQQFDAAGFNGNRVIKTPNLDRMAGKALQFTDAHVAFSLCSPSRAALLTGRYGIANGVLGLGSALNPGETTFAQLLKQAGYATGQFGKWHIRQSPEILGFDEYHFFKSNGKYYDRKTISKSDTLFPSIHCDQYAVERSIDFLKEQSEREQPFLLFLNTQTPHMNGKLIWDALPATKQRYNVEDMPVPTNHLDSLAEKPGYLAKVRNRIQARKYGYPDSLAIQQHTRDYYAVITEMDAFLGSLFQEIETLGRTEDTYIIFMSDNGWMLGDHGFTSKVLPYQPSTHVPFWISGPGISAGSSAIPVTNLDVFPTLLSLAGLPLPDNLHGENLMPILQEDQDAPIRDFLVYEGLGTYGGSRENLTVITPEYRYIETYADSSLQTLVFQELYDRKIDPMEMKNLAQEKRALPVISQFQVYIEEFKMKIIPPRK